MNGATIGIVLASGDTDAPCSRRLDERAIQTHAVTTISTRWNSLTSL